MVLPNLKGDMPIDETNLEKAGVVDKLYTKEEVLYMFKELKYNMKERDDDNDGEPLNAVDRGYHLACEHLYKEIDEILKEKKLI